MHTNMVVCAKVSRTMYAHGMHTNTVMSAKIEVPR